MTKQQRVEARVRFLEAVVSHGIAGTNVRHAAHEACHALRWKAKKPWSRKSISAAAPADPHERLHEEVTARAVEQLVCTQLGVTCGSVAKWAAHACDEASQQDGVVWPPHLFAARVRAAMADPTTIAQANRVLALKERA